MEIPIIIVKRGKIVGAHQFQHYLCIESYKSIRRREEERIYMPMKGNPIEGQHSDRIPE